VNGARGRSPAAAAQSSGGGRSGSQKPKAAAAAAVRKEKKAWVAVEKKGEDAGDDDREAVSEGYSGGDEAATKAEDRLEPESEQDNGGHLRGLDREDDAKNSLDMAANQECSDVGGSERPSEVGNICSLSVVAVKMQTVHVHRSIPHGLFMRLLKLNYLRSFICSAAARTSVESSNTFAGQNAPIAGGMPPRHRHLHAWLARALRIPEAVRRAQVKAAAARGLSGEVCQQRVAQCPAASLRIKRQFVWNITQ